MFDSALVRALAYSRIVRHVWTLGALVTAACGRSGFGTSGDAIVEQDGTAPVACVRSFSAAGDGVCVVRTDGTAWCWGSNQSGQLGNGTLSNSAVPMQVSFLSGAIAISSGENHTCAIVEGGGVHCFGHNNYGQVGDGTTTMRTTPREVSGLPPIREIATGEEHVCALTAGGEGWCWGYGGYGALGNDMLVSSPQPVAVGGLAGGVGIAVNDSASYVRDPTTGVTAWGGSVNGTLGDGSTTSRPRIGPVSVLRGVVQIAAGCHEHACAVIDDGAVWCWGDNRVGQLGDGSTLALIPEPVRAGVLSDAVEVAVGAFHSCARTRSGSVFCWGSNEFGQIGDGSTLLRRSPVQVVLPPAVRIAAGCSFSCALHADGTISCWGNNSAGALGDGTFDTRPLPAPAVFTCP